MKTCTCNVIIDLFTYLFAWRDSRTLYIYKVMVCFEGRGNQMTRLNHWPLVGNWWIYRLLTNLFPVFEAWRCIVVNNVPAKWNRRLEMKLKPTWSCTVCQEPYSVLITLPLYGIYIDNRGMASFHATKSGQCSFMAWRLRGYIRCILCSKSLNLTNYFKNPPVKTISHKLY